MTQPYTITQEDPADPADMRAVRLGLGIYNQQHAEAESFQQLNLFLRAADGSLLGGLLGATYYRWLHVDIVWVDQPLRSQGHGTRLLAAAEAEAADRGCIGCWLDTFSFQAVGFYLKNGYSIFGILDGIPLGHKRYYMRKLLRSDTPTDALPDLPAYDGDWGDEATEAFIDYGRYFVPQRDHQIQLMVDLLRPGDDPALVLDIGCGEGLFAEALLRRRQGVKVVGLDGSPLMLARARERLAPFGDRFVGRRFDLFQQAWRTADEPLFAVVSSLAIHHLDGPGKARLARDVYRMLRPGGLFIIADLVEPKLKEGWQVAADAWDEAVRDRALALDGDTRGFDQFQALKWNTYRYFDPDDIDHPSPLYDQLRWLEAAGFEDIDVYWLQAGHAVFGGRRGVS